MSNQPSSDSEILGTMHKKRSIKELSPTYIGFSGTPPLWDLINVLKSI